MPSNDTLLAHLVPKLTSMVEDAATESLGYILNKSKESMQALNDLLQEGGFEIEPIKRVKTQVSYEDGSRPDITGYDEHGANRLIVEVKFWAALLEGQASGYSQQFDQPGPAALLFISPEVRIETLWSEIRRQMENRLELIHASPGFQRARVVDTELQVMLVNWARLLDRIDAKVGDENVKSDIWQLRGLAQREDAQAFLPIHSEELSPGLGRRIFGYNKLVNDAVDARGVPEGWMSIEGLAATSQYHGYGRYIQFIGAEQVFWFGINHERWADSGDTPLWLRAYEADQGVISRIARELDVEVNSNWIPIYPKPGVEYHEVLEDVASQLKAIAEVVIRQSPAAG